MVNRRLSSFDAVLHVNLPSALFRDWTAWPVDVNGVENRTNYTDSIP